MKMLIVGAGLSGSVIARYFAERGNACVVLDERKNVAGNCFTERDPSSGIMIHAYGPHIFHTDDEEVWSYVNRHCEMMPYINKVKTTVSGQVYSLPINLHTINQFFRKAFSPDEAKEYIEAIGDKSVGEPRTFEDQALKFVGEDLYKAFFRGYTKKQWGVEPAELPASILKRLPIRFTYDDNYFNHRFQGIPKDGYTPMVESILNHENIEIRLGCAFEGTSIAADRVFYSGPLDRYFGYRLGRMDYRTLHFEEIRKEGTYQGTAVMNYGDETVPYTRITEHKFFAPWEMNRFSQTVCFKEYSRSCGPHDTPFYPIRHAKGEKLLDAYAEMARGLRGVTFIGRLGSYSYLDMDVTVARALETARLVEENIRTGKPVSAFGAFA